MDLATKTISHTYMRHLWQSYCSRCRGRNVPPPDFAAYRRAKLAGALKRGRPTSRSTFVRKRRPKSAPAPPSWSAIVSQRMATDPAYRESAINQAWDSLIEMAGETD